MISMPTGSASEHDAWRRRTSPATRRAWKNETCDYLGVTLPNASPNNLWYRFIVTDGSDTDYYADNTPALDGGLGSPSDDPVDNSYRVDGL